MSNGSLQNLVDVYKPKYTTGDEIKMLTGRPPVLYSDLEKYSSITELLGKWKFVVILYQVSSINDGHFVCLCESDSGKLLFRDSYGLKYDAEQAVGAVYDRALPRYLTELIVKDGRDCEWNTYDYQKKSSTVGTCGRWASVFSLWRNLSAQEIKTLLTTNQNSYLNDTDNAIVLLTLLPLANVREFFDSRKQKNKY